MKKWLMGIVLSLALVFALAACGGDNNNNANNGGNNTGDDNGNENANANGESSHLDELKEAGKVKIGFADEKPYAYEEDGELKGVAVDVATAVFKELGVDEVEGQLSDFGELIPGLQAKKFDVVTASMAITGDRCENVDFGEPEVKYGEGLVVAKGNPLDLHSYKDIADNPDANVIIMQGATEIDFVQDEGVDASQVQEAPDIPATFSAIEAGRADATTGTDATIKEAFESAGSDELEFVEDFENPEVEGSPSYGAAAFRQGDDELREAYNEVLADLKADDSYADFLENNFFSAELNMVESDVTTDMVCSGEVYDYD